MNCDEFETLLYASIEESIGHVNAVRMAAHEISCARCRRLAELVGGNDAVSIAEPFDGLAESVLAQTSGKPCDELAVLLAEGASDADPEALWPVHVKHCKDCRALQGALARMLHEIPALAELEPDASLTDSILRATSRAAPRRRSSVPVRGGRESFWLRFVQRPRAALEGAYATAMLLLVVTWLPWSASASPVQALDSWWRARAEAANDLSVAVLSAVDGSVQSTWRQLRPPDLTKIGERWNPVGSGSVEQDMTDRERSAAQE
jgi:hypothetical protein